MRLRQLSREIAELWRVALPVPSSRYYDMWEQVAGSCACRNCGIASIPACGLPEPEEGVHCAVVRIRLLVQNDRVVANGDGGGGQGVRLAMLNSECTC